MRGGKEHTSAGGGIDHQPVARMVENIESMLELQREHRVSLLSEIECFFVSPLQACPDRGFLLSRSLKALADRTRQGFDLRCFTDRYLEDRQERMTQTAYVEPRRHEISVDVSQDGS